MLIVFLFSLFTAQAQEPLTIQRLETHKNTALVSAPRDGHAVKKGDEYYVETPIGKCFVQVKEVLSDYFRVNTEQCGREHLAQGKSVYPKENVVIEHTTVTETETLVPAPTESVTSPFEFIEQAFFEKYLNKRLSVFASYLAGRELSGTAYLDNQTTISDFRTSNTLAIGADYRILTLPNNFSWTGGFEYSLPRSVGNYTLGTVNGNSTQRFTNDPSLEVFNLFTNARYHFNNALLAQVGVNYLFADLSDSPGELSGDFGFHGGVRYYPMVHLFVDGQINFYNLDYSLNGRVADFSLTELALKAGYTF